MSTFRNLSQILLALTVAGLVGCATNSYSKSGFVTKEDAGRLWVFRDGSKDLADFETKGEPAKSVTWVNAGPDNKTLRGPDDTTLLAYLAAAPGFTTFVRDGRIWVFEDESKGLIEFNMKGEPAKSVTRIAAGPRGVTLRSDSAETLDKYQAAIKK